MNLMRWDPYRELRTFQDRFNRAYGVSPARAEQDEESLGTWMPPVDIVEDKDKIVLAAELPGFKEDQLDIQLEDGVLTLRGERKMEKEHEGRNYHRVERSYGQFVRSFTLPSNVDRDHVRANFSDGVLEIELPKREEARPRQIKVSAQPSKKEKQAIEVGSR